MHRTAGWPKGLAAALALALLLGTRPSTAFAQQLEAAQGGTPEEQARFITAKTGSFAVGGTVLTAPNGDTFHGDHAYVQFLIPPNARELPLVLWHGGGQFSKTWETTPDGREGYQSLFVRRGFAVYILDQPRRGRAGRTTVGTTIPDGVPGESGLWGIFRLGVWPDFFPNVAFPRDSASLEQYYRQQTPNTGPSGVEERGLITDAVSALFDRIGPAILVTHSASGRLGWLTAIKNPNVKAIICYETGSYVFPEGEIPPPPPPHEAIPVSPADFEKLTKIPIQLVFGDNIPTSPHPVPTLEQWRTALIQARRFVDIVNRHGGDAQLLHLPDVGVFGNTHFPFSDLNSLEVANLLSHYLHQKGLDRRAHKSESSGVVKSAQEQ